MTNPREISRRALLRFRFERTATTPPRAAHATACRTGTFPVLRPPGAVAEEEFLQDCTKCGDCLRACPHDAIVEAPARLRAAAGTPMINPVESPCRMCSDTPCIDACTTDALRRNVTEVMGTAHISILDCIAHQGGFCSTCVEQCPVADAIECRDGRPFINAEACTGCGVCQFVCPAPRNAVAILPVRHRPSRTGHEMESE